MSKKLYRLNVSMALVLLAITVLTATVMFIKAALDITPAQDLMSNQMIGGFSTHRISFNFSGGNTFSSGDIVAVDFPAEFTLSGTWATGDFQFVDSIGRDILIINQGAGASTVTCAQDGNNVGIAVDTAANIFRVIPCSGGGWSPSGAGAPVSFTINGANPGGQLINPATAGDYVISVIDAAGDCGSGCPMAVPIVDSNLVNVSAEVLSAAVCGNGIPELGEQCDDGNVQPGDGCSATCTIEGGAPPPTDTTPPVLDYHCAIEVTRTTATISWDTNEHANSLVRCGTTSGTYPIVQTDASYVLEHRIPLTGLTESTVYYCQACSNDSAGNSACTDECFFSTSDEDPPDITNLQCTDPTPTSFTVRWNTTEMSDSNVDYDVNPGPPYANTTGDTIMVTNHVVPVTGLAVGTTYHFRARSGDFQGNEVLSADTLCSTAGGPPPEISDIRVTDIGCSSAIIRWDTNVGADSQVDYGTVAGPPYNNVELDPTIVQQHEVTLTNLEDGKLYHYRPSSTDLVGRTATGPDRTFSTFGVGPLVISGIDAVNITTNSATIIWETNKSADSAVDFGKSGNYSQTNVDSTMVMSHSIDLNGLESCTEYLYRVKSKDLCGDDEIKPNLKFTTAAGAAPAISNLQVTNVGLTSARITWETSEPANGQVEYGTDVTYGTTETISAQSTSHVFNLVGLVPGTTYHYRVSSADNCGQSVATTDATFTTGSDDDPPGCALNLSALPGDSQALLSWTNPSDPDLAGTILVRQTGSCPAGPTDGTVVYDGLETSFVNVGLVNGVTYCYGAFPYDSVGNFGCGALGQVTPEGPEDTTPPACPAIFNALPGDNSALLTWTNPSDPDFLGVRIQRGPAGSCPMLITEGLTVYDGSNQSWLDASALNDTSYCYAIFVYDTSLNYSACGSRIVTPFGPEDNTPPNCATNLVVTAGANQNLVQWINPLDPDLAGTRVVRRIDRLPVDENDGTIIFDGVGDHVYDTGLMNGITYYYGVFTYDDVPNYCIGAFGQATPRDDLPPPVPNCTDSDGGRNYYVRGTVKLTEDLQFIDACIDSETLQENYCELDGTLMMEDVDCGLGYRCEAGRCVPVIPEPPEELCGDNICQPIDCSVNCGDLSYDLYIINPDGSERHMNTEWVRVTDLAPGLQIISFEDKGEDWDYNDVEFRLDTRNCRSIAVTLISHNASWNHQVRLMIALRGVPKFDKLVWHDSHVDIGDSVYLNIEGETVICTGAENVINCPEDCEEVEPLPTEEITVDESDHINMDQLKYYATEGRLPLSVVDGVVPMYVSEYVTVVLPHDQMMMTANSVFMVYMGQVYTMIPTDEGYEAKVQMPTMTGEHLFTLIIEYTNGAVDVIDGKFLAVPYPRVLSDVDGRLEPVEDVRVSLWSDYGNGNYGLWDGDRYYQDNPLLSNRLGEFGFIVEPGDYVLRAEKDGYRTKVTLPFPVTGNVITRDLLIILIPDDIGILPYVNYLLGLAIDNYIEFADNPYVEGAAEDIAPAVVAVSTANVLVAGAATATAIPYLLYLYSFLTHPGLLLAGRRRKKWGVVYNAITKEPVDLAIVRLIDEKSGKIIRSMVTDRTGRYFFMVNEGLYRITVSKARFIFPTVYLQGEDEDVRYVDLYHGEPIEVVESSSITANIPIDPVSKEKAPRRVVWEGITRRFQGSLSVITVIAMAGAAIITPTPFVLGLFAANLIMYLFFRRLARGRRPKSWGIVYDNRTKKPLRNAVVRVFESRYNKLLDTKVTDIRGRYAFLVGNNVYYVTYERPGYQKKQIGPLDLVEVKKEEDQLIANDMALDPAKGMTAMQALKVRFKSIFNPLDVSKAKIDKAPLADKIGKTGSLIVGPNAKAEKTVVSDKPVAVPTEPAPESKPEQQIPWELQAMQQQKPTETPPPAIEQSAVKEEKPAYDTAKPTETSEAAKADQPETKKESEIPWELQQMQNLRYDADQMDKEDDKPK